MRRKLAALLTVVLVVACEQGLNSPTSEDAGTPLRPQFTIGSCDNSDPGGDSFSKHWTCGQLVTIRQTGSGPDLSSAISNAASSWSLGFGLPSFSYTSAGSASITVTRHGGSGGGQFCGVTNPSGTAMDIYPAGASCTGYWTGTADQIFLHELGHAVGLDAAYHNFDVAGYSDHCAINLPSGTGNTLTANSLCSAETEEVLYKYSVRSSAPNWGNFFITALAEAVSAGSVVSGSSITGRVSYLRVDPSDTSQLACPAPWDGENWRCLPMGTASVTWSLSPGTRASLSGGTDTTVTITGSGTTDGAETLLATLNSSGGYQTTTMFEYLSFREQAAFSVFAKTLATISGNAQTGAINNPLVDSVKVRVTAGGVGISGLTVNFAVILGGGSVSASPVTTDANGYAATRWTLGGTIGAQKITATHSGANGSPDTLTATGAAITAPSSFTRISCDLYLDGSDTTVVHNFSWTNGSTTSWEVGRSKTNNSALAFVVGSGTGTTFGYGPSTFNLGSTNNFYFWVRNVLTGGGYTNWTLVTSAPINISGSPGCQW